MSHHTVGVPLPTFLPVLYSSKVSTELWRRGASKVAFTTASFSRASSSLMSGKPVPHFTQNWSTPVSWQEGRSSFTASSWLRNMVS